MNLKDFISESLSQIIEGVKKAKSKEGLESFISPTALFGSAQNEEGKFLAQGRRIGTYVKFDVAVTTIETAEKQEGIGVFVGPIGLGSKGKSEDSSQSCNRIKFEIPISFPDK